MVSYFFVVVIQSLRHVQPFATPWTAARQAFLSFTISQRLLTYVHWVSDAIQPFSSSAAPFSSCLQSFPASVAFQWVGSSYQVAKVLEFQLQHQSFQWIFKVWFPLGLSGLISLQSKGLSSLLQRHSLKASILRHSALWSNSHICMWLLEKP